MVHTKSAGMQPLLKWPGGKRKLLKHILPVLPATFNRYFEPFAGGAALFFRLSPSSAILNDTNVELINLYRQIRDNPLEVSDQLSAMNNSKEDYYRIRASKPVDLVQRAARTYYLSNLSFNGMHRVNLRGEFNVPYGYKSEMSVHNPNVILRAQKVLRNIELLAGDFEVAVHEAGQGDLVYFDPPYTVLHGNNGFVKYNEKIFSWMDQERLAEIALRLSGQGCRVVVSNADHDSVLSLYRDFETKVIRRSSQIAANGQFRRTVTERLFWK